MSDSVVKLRIDSKEYDANIKRAGQALQQYFQKVKEGGGTLKYLDDGVLAAVQAMGKLGTQANSVKGGLRELTQATADMTVAYRALTDEEKASPIGAAMAESIQQMTERAGEMRDAMADVQASINNAASDTRMFDQIAGGMQAATAGFQTVTGAAKLMGIQMGDDVEVIAKLQAAMAVTSGFQTMQNLLQKQSALMQGVNALQKEFNILAKANPYVLLATAAVAVVTAYVAWTSGARDAEKAQKALNGEIENTKNQLSQIDKDTDFSVGVAEAAGKSWKAIHELRLEAARTKLQLADMNYDKLAASGVASAEQMKKAAEMQQSAWDNVMKVLNEGTIHDIKVRNGGGRSGGSGGRSGGGGSSSESVAADSIAAQEKYVRELEAAWRNASGPIRDDILPMLDLAKQKLEEMKSPILWKIDVNTEDLRSKIGNLTEDPEMAIKVPLQLDDKTMKIVQGQISQELAKDGKNAEKAWNAAAQSVQNVGSAFAAIEDPGVKAMGAVMQAIANIALGFAQASAAPNTAGTGWGWLAWLAAGTAAMATTISTIHSLTGYAEGGIVNGGGGGLISGNSYSADQIPIMANAGEIILNRAQQNNLAADMVDNGGGGTGVSHISGEQIYVVMSRYLRRTGRGEIVTWR